MEQPSVIYTGIQSVNDICQEKLREDEQKEQEKLDKRKCSPYQRKNIDTKQTPMIKSSSYFNLILHKRRSNRQMRRVNAPTLLNLIQQLSRQNTTDPFATQIFNGSNFF
ncbi:hypothetical protein RclHR1_00820013 [Rhizophagus clarus]|uniref:Uncharacterized protein n=1 Tax=Rhizophagus clarus TaxID=94130 RepID=A0A2Z6S065_9GLOM|nr:hypothetical protein RclHR1_00820013 [Rhizophagus clarus]GES85679.1 hypothetical protein GLOIN_2v1869068 [Rhizophagus clarus]